MSKKKYVFKFLSAYDRSGIIEFLNKMAEKGWILSNRSGVYYKFIKTDKPYFKYDITFFADTEESNNYFIEESLDYFEMRKAAGWRFLINDKKMMIFISEDPDAVPLETDPLLQVEILHQSMLMGHIPLYLFMGIMQLYNNCDFNSYYYDLSDFMIFICALTFVLDVVFYFLWYIKALKQAKEYNVFYETRTSWIIKYLQPAMILGAIITLFV